jgi:pyruvate/2-oxoglutarate/acetoin dehydrogenase E1 component
MVQVALGAATMLEEIGVDAEVVDPRTTWPLDEKTLIESVRKTSRCIVIDEGYFRYGITGEIASSSPRARSTIWTVRSDGSARGTSPYRLARQHEDSDGSE